MIPITDSCRDCRVDLPRFLDRFACRTCHERGAPENPTRCLRCLRRHKEEVHGRPLDALEMG